MTAEIRFRLAARKRSSLAPYLGWYSTYHNLLHQTWSSGFDPMTHRTMSRRFTTQLQPVPPSSMIEGTKEMFYLTTYFAVIWRGAYGRVPFRWRVRQPAAATTWATLFD